MKTLSQAGRFQQVSHRFHRGGYGANLGDPVLVFNVYGSNVCGNDALIMGVYWQKVGLKSAPVRIDESYAAMFVCEDPVSGDRASQPNSTMNMTLRPGEALVWRWGHLTSAKYSWRSSVQPDYPDTVCNGLWEYRPDAGPYTLINLNVHDNVVTSRISDAGGGHSGIIDTKGTEAFTAAVNNRFHQNTYFLGTNRAPS